MVSHPFLTTNPMYSSRRRTGTGSPSLHNPMASAAATHPLQVPLQAPPRGTNSAQAVMRACSDVRVCAQAAADVEHK